MAGAVGAQIVTIVSMAGWVLGTIPSWHFLRQFEEEGLPEEMGLGHFWAAGSRH